MQCWGIFSRRNDLDHCILAYGADTFKRMRVFNPPGEPVKRFVRGNGWTIFCIPVHDSPSSEVFMAHFLSLAMLLSLLVPQTQRLPDAFYKLPAQAREEATLIVAGTYGEGRSPCIFMSDGTRAWAMEAYIQVTKVYRGEAGGKTIALDWDDLRETGRKLTRGHRYLVLLRPTTKSMKAIRAGEYVPFWDALNGEEVLAIVELK